MDKSKHNIVFLDIDGVLNDKNSKARCGGFIGIDDSKLRLLQRICDVANARIVLVSSWKSSWCRIDKAKQDSLASYLDNKLKRFGLYIFDKTKDNGENRGSGISTWLTNHKNNVKEWVVLDDDIFSDYEKHNITPHLVKTSFYYGGLKDEHVEQAINFLMNKENK